MSIDSVIVIHNVARMTSTDTKSRLSREERLQVQLTATELSTIDDYRFGRRLPSRAAAVRDLLRLGLNAHGISPARPGSKSTSYRVVEAPAKK